jgi:hypothetical protein
VWVRTVVCKLQKGCTRLAAASDKVYQLLAHGRWFSLGIPASSTTKTGRHDIAEILLKMALNNQSINMLYPYSTNHRQVRLVNHRQVRLVNHRQVRLVNHRQVNHNQVKVVNHSQVRLVNDRQVMLVNHRQVRLVKMNAFFSYRENMNVYGQD